MASLLLCLLRLLLCLDQNLHPPFSLDQLTLPLACLLPPARFTGRSSAAAPRTFSPLLSSPQYGSQIKRNCTTTTATLGIKLLPRLATCWSFPHLVNDFGRSKNDDGICK